MTNLGAKLLQQIEVMRKEVLYDIFLYIHKVYDALDWESALAILEGCGVGPQVFQLLTRYWYWATIVARLVDNLCAPFRGTRCHPWRIKLDS